jgi:WD40 repeat protein
MPSEASHPRLVPGQRVDSVEVIRLIGRGGMGEVWLGRDLVLGRKVALKLALPARLAAPGATERFLREARAVARVAHPHVVVVYGTGTVDGVPYMAMEYLEGETLAARLTRVRHAPREGLHLARDIASALRAAHEAGLVHRDLKPENVLLPVDGRLRVLDFGLARGAEDEPEASVPEADSEAPGSRRAGTAPYMAPEQWRGAPQGPAVDIWALGVMLFEILAGERPFPGTGWAVGARVCAPEAAPSLAERVAGLPPAIVDLVARCLAKDPADRPSSAEILAEIEAQTRSRGAAPGTTDSSPYRGLLPFGPGQAAQFFGRDRELAVLLEALHRQALLPVVGPSGAGKSSFLLAGLIPALMDRGGWTALTLRPGGAPFAALAERLARGEGGWTSGTASPPDRPPDDLAARLQEQPPQLGVALRQRARESGRRVLLVVDQLEEIFTLGCPAAERHAFCDALLAAADDPEAPVRVAFTLREDFLGHLAEHTGLARSAVQGVTCLRAPDAQALEEILVLPLEPTGLRFEEGLVQEMVQAVLEEPAGLPMLQLCALRLWEARDRERRLLTWQAYRAMGGVGGALASFADGVVDGLSDPQVASARALLLRLCHPDGTRDRIARAALISELGPGVEPILDRLLEARLLTARRAPGGGVLLELSHETLTTRWERLRRWREEARVDLATLAQARAAAEHWEQRGRRAEDLWRGETLEEARRWARRFDAGLPPSVELFLAASLRESERTARRRRALVGGALGAAALVSLGAVLSAVLIAGKEREARGRWAQALLSDARSAFQRHDHVEARAKLRTSLETGDSPGGRALLLAMGREPRVFEARTPGVNYFAAWAPDGRTLATGGSDDALRIWDTVTGAVRIVRDAGAAYSIAWSPDQHLLAWGDGIGRLALLDTASLERRWRVQAHESLVNQVLWSRDGSRLYSVSVDGDLRWSDPQSGEIAAPLDLNLQTPLAAGGDPDLLYTANGLWRVSTGEREASFSCPAGDPGGVQLDPTAQLAVGLNREGTVPVCEAATGALIDEIPTTGGDMWRAGQFQWSDDGGRLLVESGEDGLILRDVRTRRDLARWSMVPFAEALRGDGQQVAFADFDATVQVWRVPEGAARPPSGHLDEVDTVAWSPDGGQLASVSWDQTVLLWDPDTGHPELLGRHDDAVRNLAWSPDGRTLATASTDSSVRLWDVVARREILSLGGDGQYPYGVAWTRDGQALLTTGYDARVRLWDVVDGRELREPLRVGAHAHEVMLFPGEAGAAAITVGSLGALLRLDLDRWEVTPFIETQAPGLGALAFSPDGSLVAFLGYDFVLYLGEVATRSLRWQRLDDGTYQGHPVWLDDGDTLAVGGWDGWLRGLDPADGTLRWARGPFDGMLATALQPDGDLLALSGNACTIRFWDLTADRLRWRAPVLLDSPEGPLVVGSGGIQRLHPDGTATSAGDLIAPLRTVLDHTDAKARIARAAPDGLLLVQTWDQAVEGWDLATGERRWRQEIPWLADAVPHPGGFASLAEGAVRIWRCSGDSCEGRDLTAKDVSRIGTAPDGGLLLATPDAVWLLAPDGGRERTWPAQPGITSLLYDGKTLMVGYENGPVEELLEGARAGGWATPFEDIPGASLINLLPGPQGSLIGGYDNGALRVWDRADGHLLLAEQLHGPVRHLLLRDHALYAVTEPGDRITLDLTLFYADREAILEQVARDIPVVWEDGVVEKAGGSRR